MSFKVLTNIGLWAVVIAGGLENIQAFWNGKSLGGTRPETAAIKEADEGGTDIHG